MRRGAFESYPAQSSALPKNTGELELMDNLSENLDNLADLHRDRSADRHRRRSGLEGARNESGIIAGRTRQET